MPKRSSTKNTPSREPSKGAFNALQRVIEATEKAADKHEKNPAAAALGRLGGLRGGPARAKSLSAAKRKAIAQEAAAARWKQHGKSK